MRPPGGRQGARMGFLPFSGAFLRVPEGALYLPLGVLAGHIVPLVMELLALAQAQLQLHAPFLQVDRQGNQRVALPLHQTIQLADLAFVQQQPLGPQGIPVELVALLIGADVHAFHPHFPRPDHRPALLQVDPALTHGLHLGAEELHAALVLFLHEIIVPGFPVLRHGPVSYTHLTLPTT